LAAEALGIVKPKDPAVVEALNEALKDKDQGVRAAARKSLEQIKAKKEGK
jgi:HEAT repeat protein